MGIYIPIEMPKLGECIVVYGDGDVWHHGKRIAKVGTAVEVPPHGRLIDADALIDEAYQPGAYGYVDAIQIENAPTIIPAEGGADR